MVKLTRLDKNWPFSDKWHFYTKIDFHNSKYKYSVAVNQQQNGKFSLALIRLNSNSMISI